MSDKQTYPNDNSSQENKSLEDAIKFSGKSNYCSILVGAIMACLKK